MANTSANPSRTLASLADQPIFCAWLLEPHPTNPDRSVKPPYSVRTRRKCDTADPSHLGTRAQAERAAEAIDGGVGLVLMPLPDDPELAIGMIDKDGCRTPETGALEPHVQSITARFGYCEVSPSQEGVKSFFLFRVADLEKIQNMIGKDKLAISWKRGEHEGIELYLGKRYGTLTGQAIDDHSVLIGEPELRIVDVADLRWLIQVAGPEYMGKLHQGGVVDSVRDNSGSAEAWRFCLDRFRAGDEEGEVSEALHDDDNAAGEWARRARPGEVAKTVKKAAREIAAEKDRKQARLGERDVIGGDAPAIGDVEAHGDLWLGRLFAHRYRGRLLYVASTKEWLRFGGSTWTLLTGPGLDALCKGIAGEALDEAMAAVRADPSDANRRHLAVAIQTARSIEKCRRIADSGSSEPGMHVHAPDAFDSDPWLLGVQNGVVDLRTGELRPGCPEDMISRVAGTYYDPDATCPMWDRFKEEALPEVERRKFVNLIAGYTATGVVDEEIFIFNYGTGANGKSVFANVMFAMMGEYAVTCSSALVVRSHDKSAAERQIARLPGRRLVSVNEVRQGAIWDDELLKVVASREHISIRKLYSEAVDCTPTHTAWMRGNALPGALDDTDGLWRRLVPILWSSQFPPERRIPDLDKRIIADELPGVLAWAVRGATAYAKAVAEAGAGKKALPLPTSVQRFRAQYRRDTDVVGRFIAETFITDPSCTVTSAEAWVRWKWFCDEENIKPGSQTAFGRTMTARGFKRHPDPAIRQYVGIRLREPDRQHLTALTDVDVAPGGAVVELPADCLDLI